MVKGGIDIGFGDVKAVFSDGRKLKFPTAVALDPGGVLNVDTRGEEGMCSFNGANYYVGATALAMGQTFSTKSANFLESFTPLLIHVAIQSAGYKPGDIGELVIGLPLGNFTNVNKAFLQRKLDEGNIDGRRLVFSRVEMLPQGVGVLLDARLDGNGKEIPGTNVNTLVLDVGFNTVDVVVAINGQAKRGRSEMLERSGISRVCEKLGGVIRERTTAMLSEQQVKDVLFNGGLEVYGKYTDFTDDIAIAVGNYADWFYSEIDSRWDEYMKQFKKVILAGGGAHIVGPYMPKHMYNLVVPPDPEFANARGFLKWLCGNEKSA